MASFGSIVLSSVVQSGREPSPSRAKNVGRKTGSIFEEVKEVLIPQVRGKEGKHNTIQVLVDVTKPLFQGTTVIVNGVSLWVQFKYDKCPDFHYNYGRIGHDLKNWWQKINDREGKEDLRFGAWMRINSGKNSPKKKEGVQKGMNFRREESVRIGKDSENERAIKESVNMESQLFGLGVRSQGEVLQNSSRRWQIRSV
ncbi:hypothetical protein ACH5RR_008860 [Cinchona calisaya]|uniref:Zinc knuckle CX2CX4HX4C domain-containing protein n=1 Tax=Cinchona calisaya TaxID=153742 RepID=A0ABD3AEG1_9GENT